MYLLDDPFSAVDAQVCQNVFEDCVKLLLKDKTRILITHQMQHLKEADKIILLNNVNMYMYKRKIIKKKKYIEYLKSHIFYYRVELNLRGIFKVFQKIKTTCNI